ncbi:hypothetical protein SCLCIDRAFT_1216808 [Scleroderma citrinum Foug A]|uniref:Uncharacterized protein n=1 Tax=Scleroderma citrinum Foug A TaxID=1036808 RepID=A0A0C3DIJ7_9AGAM|nr:hypothetical protein SCLCIDRAFT_1216808 [Scleroderma citrinum Foug A]
MPPWHMLLVSPRRPVKIPGQMIVFGLVESGDEAMAASVESEITDDGDGGPNLDGDSMASSGSAYSTRVDSVWPGGELAGQDEYPNDETKRSSWSPRLSFQTAVRPYGRTSTRKYQIRSCKGQRSASTRHDLPGNRDMHMPRSHPERLLDPGVIEGATYYGTLIKCMKI